MSDIDTVYLSIAEASRRIEAGDLSPVDLTAAVFARIDETDEATNSYVRLMRDSALAEAEAAAERARAGARLGPLDGIPIGVKDLYDTAGVVTAAGTGAFRERVPDEDATSVRRLREAGAVITGKTNTHELALGGTTNNVHFGATHNPWKLDRVPGGSSGGSGAALAAGQCLGALGSDTGGSIRIPAALCGVTGHKPTYGLVGRGGIVPLSLTLDHAGPMTRSAEDCALMLSVLAGPDERDHDSANREGDDYGASLGEGIEGVRLAIVPSLVEELQDAVRENFERSLDVLRDLGVAIERAEPMAGAGDWRGEVAPLFLAEGSTYIEPVLKMRPQSIGEPTRGRLQGGLDIRVGDYVRALEARKDVEARYERTLNEQGLDGYVLPTSPNVAEPIADDPTTQSLEATSKFRNTSVFDHTHQPSLSVPNGLDADGLPTGLMISTALFEDALTLRIGHAYQQGTDFHAQRPPMRG
jgi:aspartyl-tRNA(Asn)/glutamyl-tRNA(Gln) amidotransferase subunit A